MRSHEFLVERVLNLWTPEEKKPYADAVWDMLQRSYKKIGGFKSAADADELVRDPGYWKLVVRNGKLTALNIYKKSGNTDNYKVIASAADTDYNPETDTYKASAQGIKDYSMVKDADIRTNRSWAEVSGPAERIMQKSGAKPISNRFANLLTGKQILELNPDGYHYTRLIQGHPHEKIIYGFVQLSAQGQAQLEKMGIGINDLPSNVAAHKT